MMGPIFHMFKKASSTSAVFSSASNFSAISNSGILAHVYDAVRRA
jgi:hypothetical protein